VGDTVSNRFEESSLGKPETMNELIELLLIGTTALTERFTVAGHDFRVLDIFEDSLTKQVCTTPADNVAVYGR